MIYAMDGKNVLCQIDANDYDSHETSLSEYKCVDEKFDISIVAPSCR
jgi:hypothetical protein